MTSRLSTGSASWLSVFAVRGTCPREAALPHDFPLQLADAVHHHADELVDLGRLDRQRRREPDDRAARVDDRPAVPGLAVDLRDLLAVERAPRSIRLDEIDA